MRGCLEFGGGSVWNTPAVDVKTASGVVTGNPNPDYQGETGPATTAYTIPLALHADRKAGLVYQEAPHDLWDYDASAPVCCLTPRDGNGKPFRRAGSRKVGNVFMSIVSRQTAFQSQPFSSKRQHFSPAQPYRRHLLPRKAAVLCAAAAFSPRTGYFYVLGANVPMTFTAIDFQDSKPGGLGGPPHRRCHEARRRAERER